jgi:methylmalonyl-CoA/ethylmalonyl-CoA epimerase
MFTGIHHVAVVVTDLERALRLFHELIGLPVGARARVADQGVEAVLLPAGASEIELLQPIDPTGGVARFLAKRGEGLHHLCLETPNIAAAVAQAQGAGLPFIDRAPRPGLAGMIAFLHPRATQGVLVEIAQPPAPPGHEEAVHPPATPDHDVPASSPATLRRAVPVSNAPKTPRVETVYAVAADPAAAARAFARNFNGVLGPPEQDAGLDARAIRVGLGASQLCVLSPAAPSSPVARWLAERGEGLFGVGLALGNHDGARRRLQGASIPVEAPAAPASWRLRIEPAHAHGLHLLLA